MFKLMQKIILTKLSILALTALLTVSCAKTNVKPAAQNSALKNDVQNCDCAQQTTPIAKPVLLPDYALLKPAQWQD
jgi:PBP1b-binding outer membrane lipoprotein LpoB